MSIQDGKNVKKLCTQDKLRSITFMAYKRALSVDFKDKIV